MTDKYNTKQLFNKIKLQLSSEMATAKLFVIRYGISIDGNDLAEKIPGYPQKFRTKRAKKTLKVKDGKMFDSETGKVPYIPEEIYLTINGRKSVVKVNYKPDSCFKLVAEDCSLVILCDELNTRWNVELGNRQAISDLQINGFPADNYVQVIGADRVAVLGFDGCEEFYNKKECLFCDSNPIRFDEKSARPTLNQLHKEYNNDIALWLKSTEEYLISCKTAYQKLLESSNIRPHIHLHIMAGNLPENSLEWEYMLKLSATLSEIKPLNEVDSYLNILPPVDVSYLVKAHDLGFKKMIFNLEVYGENNFKAVCRGKHAVIPYPLYIERMIQSVEIFGKGNVLCGFVLGAQPIAELESGVQFLAEKGIVPDYSVFTPKKGTMWENKSQPSIEEVAAFSAFLSSIYLKYGYKSLYCNLSSRSSIMSEL